MPNALTPQHALDYLRELAPGIRACALVDAGGGLLAANIGAEELEESRKRLLAELFGELFARADTALGLAASQVEVATAGGTVYAVRDRGAAGLVLGCVADRLTLPSLMFYDLRSVLAEIDASHK